MATAARKQNPRGTLSPENILRAALAIADRDGLAGLTIRKIATELGASPMGVYRHFRNKAEIVDGLVDLVVGDYEVTNHQEDAWQDWVRETFRLMRAALLEHPGIMPLLGSAAFAGTNAMAVMNRVLEVLMEAGLRDDAVRLFHTLMSFTIGAVAIESSARIDALGPDEVDLEERERQTRVSFEGVPRSEYPHLVEQAPALARFVTEDQFIEGFDAILGTAQP